MAKSKSTPCHAPPHERAVSLPVQTMELLCCDHDQLGSLQTISPIECVCVPSLQLTVFLVKTVFF